MDLTVIGYIAYLLVAIPLTVWVARTLGANGFHFIKDVFAGDAQLAQAVNKLLQVGFYLLNFGFVALWLRTAEPVADARGVFETVAVKIGAVLLVLGILHVLNVIVLNGFRKRAHVDARALATLEPPQRPQAYGA
jgi:Zn-dependent protease with chaperone function